MSPDRALGRAQAYAAVYHESWAGLVLAVRAAHKAGATYRELATETGLSPSKIRRLCVR